MARESFDGRVATRCDGCGRPFEGERFVGAPGLTDLLGIAFCRECAEEGKVDFAAALLASPLLTAAGRASVREALIMQSRDEIRDLYAITRGHAETIGRHLEEGRN
jgi:hypothetical protein